MNRGYFILTLLLAIAPSLNGQRDRSTDTLRLGEIFVKGIPVARVLNGFGSEAIDTSALDHYRLDRISSVITDNSSLFIKNYGPGGTATTSFRGTGAVHTQLLWNDLSLNSPMAGMADLSLIPAGFSDQVRIYDGGASMALGSGGLGGTISLETRPDWKTGADILLNSGAGSFGQFGTLLRLRAGKGNFQSVTRAYLNMARNDFKYINKTSYAEPVYERRRDSESKIGSFMQEFYSRGRRSVTKAAMWYTRAERYLPSSVLISRPAHTEKQTDESFRSVVSHNLYLGNADLEGSAAWLSEELVYINEHAGIYSRNRSNTLVLRTGADINAGKNTSIRLVLSDEMNFINSVNYGSLRKRNIASVTASARHVWGGRLGTVLLFRENIDDFRLLKPDFSAAADYTAKLKGESVFRVIFSRNSRLPSLNDRFWNPGGNPMLRNEYGLTGEFSATHKRKIGPGTEIVAGLSIYAGKIYDLIQWRPGSSSYWVPENISESTLRGFESEMEISHTRGNFSISANNSWSLNRSVYLDPSLSDTHRQLAYVPLNLLNSCIRIGYRRFYSLILTSYTGKRFTDVQNEDYLNGYILSDLTAGIRLEKNGRSLDISLKAENILGTGYEIIAWYPMPGRSFLFSLTTHFAR